MSRKRTGQNKLRTVGEARRLRASSPTAPARLTLTDIGERRTVEATYQSLFENMLNGVAHCRMIFENGIPVDYEIIRVNPAYEKATGLEGVEGRRISDIIPGYCRDNPESLEVFGRVAQTGESTRWEHYLAALNRWYAFSIYSPAPGEFVVIIDDITERKRNENSLRIQAERAHALLELPDAAGRMSEQDFMQYGQELAERVTGSEIAFVHFINDDEETIELAAWSHRTLEHYCKAAYDKHYPVSQAGIWADALRRKAPVVFNDYPGTPDRRGLPKGHAELKRIVSVPVMEDGKVVMLAGVGNKAEPYSDLDVESVQLIADSIWRIVQRRRSETLLRKLSLAVEQSPESIVITNLDAEIEYVNAAFVKTTGYRRDEVLGRNPRILQSGKTPPENYVGLWDAITQGQTWQGELYNRRKDGSEYTEFAIVAPIRQHNGRITNYLAIKEDITEQRRAADAIRESKILLQRVIDSIPDWIHVKDRQHRFMLVNRSFAETFGRTPEDMVGRRDADFLPPETCAADNDMEIPGLRADDDAVFGGRIIHNPCDKIVLDGGEVRVFDTFKGPLRDSAQRIYGILCYRRDVTERFNTEQEQQVLETQLRQAQKMELIGHLTGGIAHDFNNILAAMFGYAELAQMSLAVKENPPLSLYLQEIVQAGIRAKELVSQLLTFSHRRETANEAILVAPIVKEVAKLLRSTMPATISIKTVVGKGLPEALISSVHLHQILMNLGVNARDAVEGNGTVLIEAEAVVLERLQVCSSCHQNFSGAFLSISVSDTGTGIAPMNLLKIFDPFFTTKDVGQGSGLGLSVLHGIVHSANGHIEVLTALGKGTEFRIYLPAHVRETEPVARNVGADAESAPVRGHVLLVDDEPSIVGFMTTLLEDLGCTVTGLTRATAALRRFQDDPHDIDMVITDQTMPDLTGAELARAMLARRPDLPVVLVTGYSNTIDETTARQIGIRRFLMKPVPAKILCDVVAECLAGKSPEA